MSERVKVVVRCRPMNAKEKKANSENIIHVDRKLMQIQIRKRNTKDEIPRAFTFDAVFGPDSTQKQLYSAVGFDICENVLKGYNGTIFAYGQTGCGKSFTMEGNRSVPELRGIIPNCIESIFREISLSTGSNKKFLVRVSYIEIYNNEVRDLLSRNPSKSLAVKEDKNGIPYVKDVSLPEVSSVEMVEQYMNDGTKNRQTAFTLMNATSSRSHSIFTLRVEIGEERENDAHITAGKLNLVDLAGSERQSKTGASGKRLQEATKINLSLTALGNVIAALVASSKVSKKKRKKFFIPYRNSKLTRLLQDSLGGNTKTVMIAAISPADYNYDETLGTLRYANRAKNIKNKPVINEDPKDALLRQYQDEINRLKKILQDKELPTMSNQNQPKKFGGSLLQHAKATINKTLHHKENQDINQKIDNKIYEEKTLLENKLKELEKRLLSGENEVEKNKALRKLQEAERKAAIEESKRVDLARQKNTLEEETMLLERRYNNIQEELESKTENIRLLRKKIRNMKLEQTDMQNEIDNDRDRMNRTLNDFQEETKRRLLYEQIIQEIFLTGPEFIKITENSTYDEEKKKWILPKVDRHQLPMVNRRSSKKVNEEKPRRIPHVRNKLSKSQRQDEEKLVCHSTAGLRNARYNRSNIDHKSSTTLPRSSQEEALCAKPKKQKTPRIARLNALSQKPSLPSAQSISAQVPSQASIIKRKKQDSRKRRPRPIANAPNLAPIPKFVPAHQPFWKDSQQIPQLKSKLSQERPLPVNNSELDFMLNALSMVPKRKQWRVPTEVEINTRMSNMPRPR